MHRDRLRRSGRCARRASRRGCRTARSRCASSRRRCRSRRARPTEHVDRRQLLGEDDRVLVVVVEHERPDAERRRWRRPSPSSPGPAPAGRRSDRAATRCRSRAPRFGGAVSASSMPEPAVDSCTPNRNGRSGIEVTARGYWPQITQRTPGQMPHGVERLPDSDRPPPLGWRTLCVPSPGCSDWVSSSAPVHCSSRRSWWPSRLACGRRPTPTRSCRSTLPRVHAARPQLVRVRPQRRPDRDLRAGEQPTDQPRTRSPSA